MLYSAEVPNNIISTPKLQKDDMKVLFGKEGVEVYKDGKVVLDGELDVLNYIKIVVVEAVDGQVQYLNSNNKVTNGYELWHARLGHISRGKFEDIKRNSLFEDVDIIKKIKCNDGLCEACVMGKQCKLPFNERKDKSHITRPLFQIHSDVCGPISPSTTNQKKYFVTFIDQFTHYCVTYLIRE